MSTSNLACFALASTLFAGCGGTVIDSGGGGSGTTSGTTGSTTSMSVTTNTNSTTTMTKPVSCGGLDFCSCSHTDGCEVVYGDCICGCDYQCPGEPSCVCGCGGGPYFGCAPSSCQGPFNFQSTDKVGFDAQGCPVVMP